MTGEDDELLLVAIAEQEFMDEYRRRIAASQQPSGLVFPSNAYILEDASQYYITEDALTVYVPEV